MPAARFIRRRFYLKSLLERFRAKWTPVRVKKTRQNKKLEPRSDSIGTAKALATGHNSSAARSNARRFYYAPMREKRLPRCSEGGKS